MKRFDVLIFNSKYMNKNIFHLLCTVIRALIYGAVIFKVPLHSLVHILHLVTERYFVKNYSGTCIVCVCVCVCVDFQPQYYSLELQEGKFPTNFL